MQQESSLSSILISPGLISPLIPSLKGIYSEMEETEIYSHTRPTVNRHNIKTLPFLQISSEYGLISFE